MIYKLYKYDSDINLFYCDTNQTLLKKNNVMNDEVIKIHRGVDNRIPFRVFNRNRKPQPIQHLTVIAKIINTDTDEKVLEKVCHFGTEKGTVELFLSEFEVSKLECGFYTMVVVGEDNTGSFQDDLSPRTPFFTDHDNEIVFDLEVSGKADYIPETTYEIKEDEWKLEMADSSENVTYSSAIPANQTKRHINSAHTIAMYVENFTGYIEIYGTLDEQPSHDIREYFLVNITPIKTRISFENYTGIFPISFLANFNWIKFKKFEDESNEGKITKILIRS